MTVMHDACAGLAAAARPCTERCALCTLLADYSDYDYMYGRVDGMYTIRTVSIDYATALGTAPAVCTAVGAGWLLAGTGTAAANY
jgi:hypothetical protein